MLKAAASSNAHGMHFLRCADDVDDAWWRAGGGGGGGWRGGDDAAARPADGGVYVLQRAVSRPVLLGGRKFHVRLLAVGVGALEVYVAHDARVLVAGAACVVRAPARAAGATFYTRMQIRARCDGGGRAGDEPIGAGGAGRVRSAGARMRLCGCVGGCGCASMCACGRACVLAR